MVALLRAANKETAMIDPNARFCRILLQLAMKDLTGREADHFREHCSVLKISGFRDQYLVEWSNADSNDSGTFALEVQADNVADAKAHAVRHWLEHHAETMRARDWPPRDL